MMRLPDWLCEGCGTPYVDDEGASWPYCPACSADEIEQDLRDSIDYDIEGVLFGSLARRLCELGYRKVPS